MRYFDISDFDCQETGNNKMCQDFLDKLDQLCATILVSRLLLPLGIEIHPIVSSLVNQSLERTARALPQTFASGSGAEGYKLASEAFKAGFTGIGIAKTFIHVDTRKTTPVIWIY